jgi:hypothetical protein
MGMESANGTWEYSHGKLLATPSTSIVNNNYYLTILRTLGLSVSGEF